MRSPERTPLAGPSRQRKKRTSKTHSGKLASPAHPREFVEYCWCSVILRKSEMLFFKRSRSSRLPNMPTTLKPTTDRRQVPTTEDKLLLSGTFRWAAKRLGVSEYTIRNWINDGQLVNRLSIITQAFVYTGHVDRAEGWLAPILFALDCAALPEDTGVQVHVAQLADLEEDVREESWRRFPSPENAERFIRAIDLGMAEQRKLRACLKRDLERGEVSQ